MNSAKQELRHILSQRLITGQTVSKWMPREKSSRAAVAKELREFMCLSPQQYRKQVADLSETTEDLMCAKQWDSIDFGKVPSLAHARYQKAFNRNAPELYQAYKEALVSGDAKINASAVYPHDVIKSIKCGDENVAAAQWEALPNYMSDSNVLPMVDVSGSMSCSVGGNKSLECIDISVALGLYCAEKNRGAFKDMFLTFSETSKLEVLRGDILSKYRQLISVDWGMSTNLNSAFDAVLKVGVTNSVPEADMPKYIAIFSDMQFDVSSPDYDDSAIEMIRRKYEAAGYEVPKIIFWNLNSSDNIPVKFNEQGVALVSGFSPAIMKSILAAKEFTPYSIMMQTINQPRYEL